MGEQPVVAEADDAEEPAGAQGTPPGDEGEPREGGARRGRRDRWGRGRDRKKGGEPEAPVAAETGGERDEPQERPVAPPPRPVVELVIPELALEEQPARKWQPLPRRLPRW